ncbi:MAG: hypothetical protein CMM41_04870 [Rhodospirillaceae bacterium]|nr:hypothetical protein [Rhodospirillaceae bacterium]
MNSPLLQKQNHVAAKDFEISVTPIDNFFQMLRGFTYVADIIVQRYQRHLYLIFLFSNNTSDWHF